jgi:soluble lytic murein transglycosylase-like protein
MRCIPLVIACTLLCVGHAAAAGIYGYTTPDGTLHLTDMPDDPRFELLLAEHEGRAPVVGRKLLPMRSRPYHEDIAAAARSHGLDAALLHAVISVESAYRVEAVSPKGARGLMQVMPATARRFGVTESDLSRPAANISAGTRYLAGLVRMFDGDLKLALAAYNAGEQAVLKYGGKIPPYAETQAYVPRVIEIYQALRGR